MRPRAQLLVRLSAAALSAAATSTTALDVRADPELPVSVEVVRRDEPLYAEPAATARRRGAAQRGARLPVFGTRAGPGCASGYFLVGPLAWICAEGVVPSRGLPVATLSAPSLAGLPYRYFFVRDDGSFGYRDLSTAEEGVPDAQLQPGFGVAITRTGHRPDGGDPFGLTTHGLWVPLRDLGGPVVPPPALGVELDGADIAWLVADDPKVFVAPGGGRRRDFALTRLMRVAVLERLAHGKEAWLRIGERAFVRERDTVSPRFTPPPEGTRPGERWIDVDLERQLVTAYRGETPVFATLASTGRGAVGSEQATPPGSYRVWAKLRASDMDNLENVEAGSNYAIQSVPWVLYFHRGYGLHGAFWHHAFGRVQSHGCVNLTPADAERLFGFTSPRLPEGWSAVFPTDYEPGTMVRVR
ncbi:MAG TPA: L,D-transpeptidase [Polyangiaceae bacterium]